jgi:phospholipid/cholesterol/gamma-HCH transport system substrate-binding protein
MKNTLETRLGVFFALALLAAAIILEMVGGTDLFKHGLRLEARFHNVQELKLGDPVKMAGKQIGRVADIRFDDDRVLVVLKITDSTARVRTDSQATIKFTGLMGQNYVSLSFGSAKGELLRDGDALETVDPQDISVLLAKLDGVASDVKKITGNLSDVKIDEIIMPFSDFIKEARPRIMTILTNVQAVAGMIATGQGTVGKLINDDALYNSALSTVTNLNATAEDVRAAVTRGQAIIADINAGKGTVGKLVRDEKLYNEATDAATNLKEILHKINQGKGSVGNLVNDPALINNAKLTLQKLDKATESIEDQGPLSVIGILSSPLGF